MGRQVSWRTGFVANGGETPHDPSRDSVQWASAILGLDAAAASRQGMHLTVIIPTRNRAALLRDALASLSTQTLPVDQFEVLVVDNGSTDDTKNAAESAAKAGLPLRYLCASEPGLHSGRHAGLREARGEVLVYADDDIEALPSWLESVASAFAAPDVALVGGNNVPAFVEPPPAWLVRLWQRPASIGGRALSVLSILELPGPRRELCPCYVWGCNFSIRKQVLLAAGGFHPDSMPAELLHLRGDGESSVARFVAKQGLRCLFDPGASVRHKVTPDRMTFAYFRKRGWSQGISESYTALRAGRTIDAVWIGARHALRWARLGATAAWASDADVHRAQFELAAGLVAGYAHHQRLYRQSAELRDWVHKPTYL
jgi:glycosyltransferase involved in cell wall biosynthesis